MVFTHIFILLIGLIVLVKGADYFIKSSVKIARYLGISHFLIGLTLIALGTSLPELASAIIASLRQESGLIIGTITGANIANLCLVIGSAAIIAPIVTNKEMLQRDIHMIIFVSILFMVTILNNSINYLEGILLLTLFVAYTAFLFEAKPSKSRNKDFKEFVTYITHFGYILTLKNTLHLLRKNVKAQKNAELTQLGRQLTILIISGIVIVVGANYVVTEALYFAHLLNIPSTLAGIFVAIGTTLPELSVSITAARKKLGGIAIGNAIGSCITNTLLILGIASLINPLSVEPITQYVLAPFFIIVSFALFIMIRTKWSLKKKEGIILLFLYGLFLLASLILTNII